MGMSYEDLERALVRQGKMNLEQRAEAERNQQSLETMAHEVGERVEQIGKLTAENERLRAALRYIAAMPDEGNEWEGRDYFRDMRHLAQETLGVVEQSTRGNME